MKKKHGRNKFRRLLNDLGTPKKYYYFCWKNKIDNFKMKYSEMTKEDFMKKFKFSSKSMAIFKQWEGSQEYQKIYRALLEIKSDEDLINIYNVVRDKALTGEDKAVKTFIS
ncbi:hypothetical protein [Clostridium coskatii]|uniref:Uncharacterized protein n=1 Tax=Clostridium coskatii TaxID=1705578 RepID=A0A168R7D7_9CLOT|nr:hypothetical protein [Clostridium coskatii]OAA90144.1 hypothetical protein WX73_02108 [Clostridium coskatii]OBR91078.1 hypothetical protein CLCOS_36560 [Clostridium coskatii]